MAVAEMPISPIMEANVKLLSPITSADIPLARMSHVGELRSQVRGTDKVQGRVWI